MGGKQLVNKDNIQPEMQPATSQLISPHATFESQQPAPQSTDRSPAVAAGGHVEHVNVKYRDSDYSTIEN